MRPLGGRRAREAARALLHASGVRKAEHIDVEEIARGCGAEIVIGKLDGATARVVRFGTKARIRVSERILNEGARRFAIAHELGHLVLGHSIPTESDAQRFISRACERKRGVDDPETEANTFAAEILMPEWLVERHCHVSSIGLHHVHHIAREFRTSSVASAVRFAELTRERVAAVYSERGAVKWVAPSASFPAQVARGTMLHADTLAYAYFHCGGLAHDARSVRAGAWLPKLTADRADIHIVEHAELVPGWKGVLSLVWIPQHVAERLLMERFP